MLTVCPIFFYLILDSIKIRLTCGFNKHKENKTTTTTKKATLSLKIDHFKNLELITAFGPIPIATGIIFIQANTLFCLSAFVKGEKQSEEEILIWISEDLKNCPLPLRLSEHASQCKVPPGSTRNINQLISLVFFFLNFKPEMTWNAVTIEQYLLACKKIIQV